MSLPDAALQADLMSMMSPAVAPDPTRVRIKICGITNVQNALQAVECGVDYIGLIFATASPRAVGIAKAAEIARCVAALPVQVVGVFQNPTLTEVQAVLDTVPLHYVQFHGEESNAFRAQIACPQIQFFPLTVPETLTTLVQTQQCKSPENPNYCLLEPPKGSGFSTIDWLNADMANLAALRTLVARQPVFVAGGLNPDNIALLLGEVTPYAVDVASGVEMSPGLKDLDKMEQFCKLVKAHRPEARNVPANDPAADNLPRQSTQTIPKKDA